MSSLFEQLTSQLGGDTVGQLSRQLGADEDSTSQALGAAVPVLLAALQRNASKPGGAEALASALERDHDGGVLDDLQSYVSSGGRRSEGAGILGHVLGGQRAQVEQGIGQAAGLDASQAGSLLEMAAPLVLGMLGKEKRSRGLDSAGLAGMLGEERSRVENAAPQAQSMLSRMLDQDGDGSMADDVAKMGMNILGGFFKKR